MSPDPLPRLFAHLAWADTRALESLRAAVPGVEDGVRALAHILAAEHIWLTRLEGRPPQHPVFPVLTLDECGALARQNHAEFARYLAALTPTEIARIVVYKTSAGAEVTTPVSDILLHVALHGAYHRGQIARSVRQSGCEPIATDYIAFVRGAVAPTRNEAKPTHSPDPGARP